MNRLLIMRSTLAIAVCLSAADSAHAGRSCERRPLSAQTLERGMTLAETAARTLDASGHELVLIARAGQDLTKYGVHYSHLAFAYRHPDGSGGHVWRVLHKLNECGTSASAIYRQGLGEFFLDDLWRYEAAYIAPAKKVQARLVAMLQDNRQAVSLHHRPYSVVSYAWGQKYQQSNQWVIETLAFAMAPYAKSRPAAQGWLQRQGYMPTELRIGTLTRLGGRVSAANVAFDDHPPAKRFTDRIETVTVDSVFEWMQHTGLGSGVSTFQLEPEARPTICCGHRIRHIPQ